MHLPRLRRERKVHLARDNITVPLSGLCSPECASVQASTVRSRRRSRHGVTFSCFSPLSLLTCDVRQVRYGSKWLLVQWINEAAEAFPTACSRMPETIQSVSCISFPSHYPGTAMPEKARCIQPELKNFREAAAKKAHFPASDRLSSSFLNHRTTMFTLSRNDIPHVRTLPRSSRHSQIYILLPAH
jgi:hypothetical protein